MEKVLVKMQSRHAKWQPGEIAGFKPKLAKAMVKSGAAVLYDCGFGPGVCHPRDEKGNLMPKPQDKPKGKAKGKPKGAADKGTPKGVVNK